MKHTLKKTAPRGYLMLLSLIFGAIFLTVLGALSSFALTQNRVQIYTESRSKALALAEAGLEYYHWYLAHYPTSSTTGTSTLNYYDPETGLPTGTVSLGVTVNQSCGQTTSIDLLSKGMSSDGTGATRSIYTRYAQPSVANYSYILNDSVWAGADRIINGPYHSNGGVHMDGTANSGVTSSLTTWSCTPSFGCVATTTQPGVFGSGPNKALWQYAVPQVDFAGIATNFTSLKAIAQSNGKYLPRISTGTGIPSANGSTPGYWNGYHLIFNANGTVTVRKVTATLAIADQQINPTDPTIDHTVITAETAYQIYTLPSTCGLIFVEDNTWIEGAIPQKITIVAANVTPSQVGITPNIMLKNNTTYPNTASGLTAIAQNNVLVTADSPNIMSLSGVFIAQTGAFGRNYYGCPTAYEPRSQLSIHGTTVSYKRTGTKWVGGCGATDAGYQNRIDGFDRALASDPPPFTPVLTTDYQFRDWREQ